MAREKERKKRGTENIGGGTIDMTSMIDVTFQLIIFFLCLKFKTLEGKLAAYLPKDVGVNTTSAEPIEKLDVHIYNNGKGTKISKEGERSKWTGRKSKWIVDNIPYYTIPKLESGLRKFARERRDPETDKPIPVTVHAHKDVFYGEVTKTVDICLFSGFKEVTFAGGHTK